MKKSLKFALLFLTTLTFIACGGGSSGGGNTAGGGNPDGETTTKIRISEATGDEGSMVTFKVIANPAIAEPITFDYRIDFESQTASADDLSSDISGRSTIAASSDSTTISILIKDDIFKEPAETFRIVLSNLAPAGAIFTNNKALGTISASDPTEIRISDAEGKEGENINFTVTSAPTNAKPISFYYRLHLSTSANTVNANDFTGNFGGTRHIAANSDSTTISILTADDNLRENNETFFVVLSDLAPTSDVAFGDHIGEGTILANDDATGIVTISLVTDATASEENTGRINFQVKSEFTAISPFTFGYEVDLNNSSADTDDFAGATSGTATIPVGRDSTTISISLRQDTTVEPNETFRFLITNPSANATIDSAKNSAIGTILNDDLGEISGATATPSARQVTLSWTNPNSNLFAGVIIAQVIGTTAPPNCNGATIMLNSPASTHTIVGLTDGFTYSFLICARSMTDSHSSGVGVTNVIPDGDDDSDAFMNSMDVDDDNDGLIEIFDATQFNNIRHNLAGTSYDDEADDGVGNAGSTTGAPTIGNTAEDYACAPATSGLCGYELVADINLNSFNDGTWDPIGTFTAIFDGNNNRISGLRITGNNDIGLFSTAQNATISNLILADVRIIGNGNVGALVGQATMNSTLSNIELIGDASQESSNAEITGAGANVGGLVGEFFGTISDASSSLTVSGGTGIYIGGLVGRLQSGSIKYSNSSGFVSASGTSVGGLVGGTGNGTTINNSWASGNVSGISGTNVGGLVGQHLNATISNSWASGNVSGRTLRGGLLGSSNGTIRNSWASGSVFGNIDIGGLVGYNLGTINGRNYQLDDATGTNVNLANVDPVNGHSFVLGGTVQGGTVVGNRANGLRALENLSGDASGDGNISYGTHSEWHAGFDIDNLRSTIVADFDLETMFCDTNRNGRIDGDEQMANNSVWVMAPAANNVTTASTDTAGGGKQGYYQIPALRCIGYTKGKTPTEINAIRKANIDRQRRLFPR